MSDFQTLESLGMVFPEGQHIFTDQRQISRDLLAMDAAPGLSTTANAGIPAFMNAYVDPDLIDVVFSPLRGGEIAGEEKKGDWQTATAIFPVVEATGEVAAYGDYNNDGTSDINADFPDRQSYTYETFARWGELALARAGEARISLAARLRSSAAMRLNRFQNQTYFFGVSGLRNYGWLNDPRLPASITASAKAAGGSNWSKATPEEIAADVVALIGQLRTQTAGHVTTTSPITIGLSPTRAGMMTLPNMYGLSPWDLITKQYKNLRFVEAIEFGDLNSQTSQMMIAVADEVGGQKVGTAAFTEKLRAHSVVTHASSWSQKMSQGSFGAVIWVPAGVASIAGI